MLPAMLALVLAGAAAPVSQLAAAPAPMAAPAPVAVPPAESGVRVHRASLKELGALFPLQLRGVDGTSGVAFSVRNDEVVVGAKLKLNYSYSPALLTNLSHIKVLVNEQVAATIPVTTQQAELASLTFARADAWIATWGTGQRDKPLRSLKSVIVIGLRGIGQLTATAFKSLKPR